MSRLNLGEVQDGSGLPLGRSETSRGTLREVRNGSGNLEEVWDVSGNLGEVWDVSGTLREVWEGSGETRGGPRGVEGPSAW